ncbi:hypothetical protein ACICHK_36790 [Streptomyces sp. AHU1]|uniref:hypothetical protein n=1 Tax=Streptomyces sp. AHU1 TaxID=3377215 RepID=UPI003877E9AB
MRARTIVVILATAAVLGLLTGRFVLPARSAPTAPPGAAPSSAGSGSPAPKPADGPVTDRHLLTAAEFEKVGFTRRIRVRDRVGDGHYANAACAGEKTLEQTLGEEDAHFRGLMTTGETDDSDPTLAVDPEDQVAREVAADARSPALARNYAQRLLLEEVPCQEATPSHWVYGPTHTDRRRRGHHRELAGFLRRRPEHHGNRATGQGAVRRYRRPPKRLALRCPGGPHLPGHHCDDARRPRGGDTAVRRSRPRRRR